MDGPSIEPVQIGDQVGGWDKALSFGRDPVPEPLLPRCRERGVGFLDQIEFASERRLLVLDNGPAVQNDPFPGFCFSLVIAVHACSREYYSVRRFGRSP